MSKINFFGIIIPFKNIDEKLFNCLKSILNQTYKNFRLILVSTETDKEKISLLKNYLQNVNYTFIFQPTIADNLIKIANARNMGIKDIREKYFMFCDADDVLHRDLLRRLHRYIVTYKDIDILKFGGYRIKNNKIFAQYKSKNMRPSSPQKVLSYYTKNNLRYGPLWLYCYNSKFWRDNDFQFLENKQYEDILNNYILAKAHKMGCISFRGYYYNYYSNSLTNTNYIEIQTRRANDILANYDNVYDLLTTNITDKNFLKNYLHSVLFVLVYNYKHFSGQVLDYYKKQVDLRKDKLKKFIQF